MNTQTKPRLENWSTTGSESGNKILQGNVYNHPRFTDGDHVLTSRIVELTDAGTVKTVSGSEYELGEIDPNYEALYPDARNRLFAEDNKKRIVDAAYQRGDLIDNGPNGFDGHDYEGFPGGCERMGCNDVCKALNDEKK